MNDVARTGIVFRADSITKSFRGRRVLHAATLWASPQRITVLFGRNGSGKSTLMRIAAGLLSADQGVILFDGRAIVRPALPRLARLGLFLLPERGLLPRNETVGALLEMVASRFDTAAMDAVIERLRIGELLERMPDTLSGGERRRVELAVAAVRQPRVLLADEPFMGIAPLDAENVAAELRRIAQAGASVVVTGHEVPSLFDLADEIAWLTAGTTHSLGTPEQAREDWQFHREYLGTIAGAHRR